MSESREDRPGGGAGSAATGADAGWRGERLGLPAEGAGSVAPGVLRLCALAVDVVLSALVAGLFTAPELPRNWSLLVFAVEYFGFTFAFSQTPGMRLIGLRVIRIDRPVRIGVPRSALRTVMLMLFIPALIWDRDARCLHDRFTQTAVVRS